MYLYDGEKDKIVEFTPEESIEMGCVRITPDGTKAVTITEYDVVNEEHTNLLYTDLVIKIYDLDTGEKINEIKSEKGRGIFRRLTIGLSYMKAAIRIIFYISLNMTSRLDK